MSETYLKKLTRSASSFIKIKIKTVNAHSEDPP